MARSVENNAKYYQHNSNMRNNDRVKALRSKFGQRLGWAFWAMLLEWLSFQDALEWHYSELEIMLFSAELELEPEEVKAMVDYAVRLELLEFTPEGFLIAPSLIRKLEPMFNKRGAERKRMQERRRIVAPTKPTSEIVATTNNNVAPTIEVNKELLRQQKQESATPLKKAIEELLGIDIVAPTIEENGIVAPTIPHNKNKSNIIINNTSILVERINNVESDQNFSKSKKNALSLIFDDFNEVENNSEGYSPMKKEEEEIPPKVAPKGSKEGEGKGIKKHWVEVNGDGVSTCLILRNQIEVFKLEHVGLYPDAMYEEFLLHWSEPNASNEPLWYTTKITGKSKRFNIGQRLGKWQKNNYSKILDSNGKPAKSNRTGLQKLQPTGKGSFEYGRGTVFIGLDE